jgi:SAM-dependent methyltransferase
MQNSTDPYDALADVYDLMASDDALQAFYREWRELLLQTIAERKIQVRTVVDLACGTGNSTIPWTAQRAWTVVGVDRSPAMLKLAKRKSNRVQWYCQDLRKLDLKVRADVVTCHFDALNHILHPNKLQQVFINVALMLDAGGLFQFDLNTDRWFRWLNGREKLYRMRNTFLVATNEYDPVRRIVTFRHLWFIPKRRMYEKREVEVRERAYDTAEIREMIKRAGLSLIKLRAQRKIAGKPIRMLYIARKM